MGINTEQELLQNLLKSWQSISWVEMGLLVLCVFLIVFSRILVQKIWHLPADSKRLKSRLKVFRAFNFLVIFAILLNHFIFYADSPGWAQKLLGVLMVIFSAFWATQISRFFLHKRYGKTREFNDEKIVTETYNSRMLSLLATILIIVIALIGIIQVLGFNSLLEAGGMIGILGVILALTQGSWAPDIISGLIILNSGLVEEGDVVELDEKEDMIVMVYKTKLFHTELLNLINNHRIMMGNAKLRSKSLQNLSKFASAKGLREVLKFKIGYEVPTDRIRDAFQATYDVAIADPEIKIEPDHDMELRVSDTGDDAVEWSIYYYTKDIRKLIKTRQLFRATILDYFNEQGISLATPGLRHISTAT